MGHPISFLGKKFIKNTQIVPNNPQSFFFEPKVKIQGVFFVKGAHVDNVYMGRGTSNLLTIWTPFGDNPIEMGSLAVVENSHKLPQMKHFQVDILFYDNLPI